MCRRVPLNKESKDVKSPQAMSKHSRQGNSREPYGTLRLQPGACLLNTAPGAGTAAARGRRTPGPRPPAARSGPKLQSQPRPGRAPSLGLSPAPGSSAYLLRLLPQRDAHGPQARLELGNVHPAVFVEVQFSEEVGVAGVAIPVPVAGGRGQEGSSQELEHVGAVQRPHTQLPPPGRGRDTARDAARARSCQGRDRTGRERRDGRAQPAERSGGRAGSGGARSARACLPPCLPLCLLPSLLASLLASLPSSPSSLPSSLPSSTAAWGGNALRAKRATRSPSGSARRCRPHFHACAGSAFPAGAEKHHKRCERPNWDTWARSSPPNSSLALRGSVEGA